MKRISILGGLALAALSLAACGGRSDGIDGAGTAAGVGTIYCPTQTQGRTGGDGGCVEPPAPPQTQGRT